MQKIWALIVKAFEFVKTDIWRISLKDLPRIKSFFIQQLRTVILAIRGFDEDRCFLRASSLTFYSLLSIVPVLAMAFGIAKGFGFERFLEKDLYEKFPGQEEILVQVVGFAQKLLENTKGGMIAGIGIVFLLWSVIKLLGHIENSFNDIWEIKKSRSPVRKLSDYLSIMLISPIFLVVSGSVTIFIKSQIMHILESVSILGVFSPVIVLGLKFLPHCLIGALLTIVYMVMPNTRVSFKSGFIAGMIAGISYEVVQLFYINSQVGIAKYNAVYGSFAAFPLFLFWLQVSWLIVLFGAEISFAIQNVKTYEFEQDCQGISPAFKKLLSLQVVHSMVKGFSKGEKPLTATDISNQLEIPIRLVRQILYELVDSGIASDTSTDESKEPAYQPARDINLFSIKYVVDALEHNGTDDIPVGQSKRLKALSDALNAFGNAIDNSTANKLLKDI